MGEIKVFDSEGRELRRADLDDDGQKVPNAVLNKASLIGALQLLNQIAKHDDNPQFRAAARRQADGLKAMVRRTRNGQSLTDEDILGDLPKQIETRKRKAPPTDVLTIDMK